MFANRFGELPAILTFDVLKQTLHVLQGSCSGFSSVEVGTDAGIPDEVLLKTKGQLAQEMLERAFSKGAKPAWVVGDRATGASDFILKNKGSHSCWAPSATSRSGRWSTESQHRCVRLNWLLP